LKLKKLFVRNRDGGAPNLPHRVRRHQRVNHVWRRSAWAWNAPTYQISARL